jgi:hypothetical protein
MIEDDLEFSAERWTLGEIHSRLELPFDMPHESIEPNTRKS